MFRPTADQRNSVSANAVSWRSVSQKRTVPGAFTATETFDVGADLGSLVSETCVERRPFAFTGKIHKLEVSLK